MSSIRRTYLLTEVEIQKLKELGAAYRLSDSDSVRRGIALIHDFLINNKLPDGTQAPIPRQDTPAQADGKT